ncbi:MAG: LysR family transcriptional regulator [Kineosporiaceae bacterium]|nr:LysR family transcriptional regulator [Kineosporiaceae bacterium]
MLLRQLEYVTALARERHFARAAAVCHVSQPSLSAGIAKLESELKVTIVVRGRRFAGFTPEGEQVVSWARRILADRDGLAQELAGLRRGVGGLLRVCAIPTAVVTASMLTSALCHAHPGVRVRLDSGSSRDIVRRLVDLDLDAGLTYTDNESLGDAIRVVPLYREHYLALTPDDGPLDERVEVTWAEVAALPLCLFSRDMQHRRILDGCFAETGVEVTPAVETDSVAALYAHVASRRWSTVIAHVWLATFGVPEGMRVVPITGVERTPQVGLVLAGRDPEAPLVRMLRDIAAQEDLAGRLERLRQRYPGAPSLD